MKITLYILGILLVIFVVSQVWVYASTNNTLKYDYSVEQSLGSGEVEIRKYGESLFARVELEYAEYSKISGKGFRILAGYIFGGNSQQEKISMTSPVVMEYNGSRTMEFMIPKGYKLEDLPTPDNKNIELYKRPEWKAAAITFGGFANDEHIRQHIKVLSATLEKHHFQHKGNFKFFGYNPPYQLINRRNEVVVELE